MLDYYGIRSPERERAETEWAIKQAETVSGFDWLEQEKYILKQKNERLHTTLNMLIDLDVTAANKLISNIESLTADKNKFDFLTSLFEYDYSKLIQEDRAKVISATRAVITASYTYDEYGDFIRKELEK